MSLENRLNHQLKLLIACCQTELSQTNIKFIHSYVNDAQLPVDTLINLANQHGILPLVYKSIKKINKDFPLTSQNQLLQKLKLHYQSIVQRNMLMSAELIHITNLLKDHSIEVIAFKGPTLSHMAYGDITLRQYSDLDILIPEKHLFDAASILETHSYQLYGSINFLKDPTWIALSKDMMLIHNKKKIILEMHWRLFHNTFAKHSNTINLWNKTETIKINQNNILTLNKNLLLAYLCIHGSRHLWERIEWIVDIDRLIKTKEIEWNEVLHIAKQFQSKTMLQLGISLSKRLLNTILPDTIDQMIIDKKIKKLTSITLELLEHPLPKQPSTSDVIRRKSIHASMQDTFYAKIKYWKNVFFQKNYTQVLAENKPNKNTSLVSMIRPLKLIKKFIFKR